MKIISLLLSLCIASVALAEDPAELVKLRATYDNSLRGEFQKVGKLYHGRLVELKKSYMQAENLEAAVAVDAEIKKLRETHGKMEFKPSKKVDHKTAVQKAESQNPLEGVWIHNFAKGGRGIFVCRGDEMINNNGNIGKVTHHDGTFIIEWEAGSHVLSVDPENRDVMNYKNSLGKSGTYERVKW